MKISPFGWVAKIVDQLTCVDYKGKKQASSHSGLDPESRDLPELGKALDPAFRRGDDASELKGGAYLCCKSP